MSAVRAIGTIVLVVVTLSLGTRVASADQQPPASTADSSKWQLEVHVGGVFSGNPTAGTGTLPPPGPTFMTLSQIPSRRIPSWFLGDGALLLNQVSAALNLPTRMTPADAALTSRGTERGAGANAGFRLGRRLTNRIDAEFTLDYGSGAMSLMSQTRETLETARSSFVTAFQGLFANRPDVFRNPEVFTDVFFEVSPGQQLFTTGALNVKLRTRGSLIPYVTAGGGGVFNSGAARAILFGTYSYRVPSGAVADSDFDALQITYSMPDRQLVGLLGGGVTGDISPSWGWRVDARAYVSKNGARVRFDATPGTGFQPTGTAFTFATNPALQFSSLRDVPATLNDQPLLDVTTFNGSGPQVHASLTGGVFMRLSAPKQHAAVAPGKLVYEAGLLGGLTSSSFVVVGEGAEDAPGFNARSGFSGGGYVALAAAGSISFRPEFLISTRGASVEAEDESGAIHLTYFEMPLLARVRVAETSRAHVFVLAGPAIAARLTAHARYEGESEDIKEETRGTDFGVVLGGGVGVNRFDVSVRYTWGLPKVNKDPEGGVKNRALSVMLGVSLR